MSNMNIKSFNVRTGINPEIKIMLRDLFNKHVAESNYTDLICKSVHYPYLQVWFDAIDEEPYMQTITHYSTAYKPYLFPEISISEAVERIKSYKKFTPVKIGLNNTYTAEIQSNGDVKVGCQTFSAKVRAELAKAVQNVVGS